MSAMARYGRLNSAEGLRKLLRQAQVPASFIYGCTYQPAVIASPIEPQLSLHIILLCVQSCLCDRARWHYYLQCMVSTEA